MTEPEQPARRRGPSMADRIRKRVEGVHHWMESTGFSSHILNFVLIWWRKLGTTGVAAVMAAVILPSGGYAALAYSTSRAIPGWIGDFGVEFEAADWDIHVFSLSSVARDVKLRRDAHSEPVLTAAEIEFNGTLWTVLSSLWGRGAAYNEITVRHGEVLVERSLTADYNWADFLSAVPAARRRDAADGLYTINAIYLEDIRLVYLEHVPGDSGGGVIKTSQARVIFDNVTGNILDLRPPEAGADRPTQFAVKARLADGLIEIKGEAGIFPEQLVGTAVTRVGFADSPPAGGAAYRLKVYLENIGMGAYGQMVSTTQIVPTRGTLKGTIDLQYTNVGFQCDCNLLMDDVGFAANPGVMVTKARYDEVNRSLASYRKSGTFDICGGDEEKTRDPRTTDGTMSAVMASFNAQATDTAPPNIRALTARDQHEIAGVVAVALIDDLTRESATDTALQRSIKNVGRGLKRLFGGGGK